MDREIKMYFVFLFYLREGKILFWIMDEIEKKYVVYEYLCVEVVEKIEYERKEYGMRKL